MDQAFLVQTMGLGEDEALLLLRIASRGQVTAATAARLLGKSRGRAYEVLRRLVAEGLADELPGRPLMYAARPLGAAVAGKRGELEARIAALRQAEEAFRRTESAPPPMRPGNVSLFWGVRALNREAARMAQQAHGSVLAAGTASFAGDRSGFETFLAALAKARIAGASVRLYLSDGPGVAPLREQAERALGPGHVVVYAEGLLPDVSCVIADGEVLTCLPGFHAPDEAADEALGLKVRSLALAELARSALRALLDPARGPTIDDAFAAFRDVVAQSGRDLRTMAGKGWPALRPQAELEDLARAYAAAAARGVAVRTVVHGDPAAGGAVRFGPGETRTHGQLPAWVALVDGAVAFQVVRSEAGGLTAHLSRDPSVVRLFSTLFEHFWTDGKPLPGVPGQPPPPAAVAPRRS